MRVAVTGATGLIGTAVVSALQTRGDQVVAMTRDPERAGLALDGAELHRWSDTQHSPPPAAALDGADAVIHLLGEPVAQRWTEAARRKIRDSRVLSTRSLVAGLAALADDRRPTVLISQSATGYYGAQAGGSFDELAPPGTDFLASVTTEWEREASSAPLARVVKTRTGVVLAPSGGALAKMLTPFRLGVGGPVAGGEQYVPWIHVDDVVGALLHCIDDGRATGPVNLTAPNPVTNAELSRTLGRVLHRPAVVPVPGAALRLIYGEMASIVTTGQRPLPRRLIELGYSFRFTDIEQALRDVLDKPA